ncbi:MAG: 50S ribosomal protein L29 [Candidatus Hydrogenedentes bacterium]|jgi:large subunit ribosomal protein L29|nr:50S ribosomal protein L29 [Candidatus Hydrogenedentota bacterium]
MKANELRDKTGQELDQIILDRTDALMNYRMQSATGVVDNVRGAREARKDIARIKTIQNERKRVLADAGEAN